jgi:DNA-binding MarR family transcriptional regulator/GNAT superfamily N-acetyltransferase
MDEQLVSEVRSFNRVVTLRIGALDDVFLARSLPLGQARVLWEIGNEGVDVRALRARLELDSGYLSRLLRSLEGAGFVVVEQSRTDGRVRTARLTTRGAAERAELDRLSDEAARSLLRPLTVRQRDRLVTAMTEVERLLTASAINVSVCDPRQAGARACMRAYFEELSRRFDAGFDPARSIPAGEADLRPPAGLLLLATLHGDPVGMGALKLHGETAEIKRMWVADSARGLGLGRRLLADLEDRAHAQGARRAQLETNRALTEAIALYKSAGYTQVAAFNDEPYADHWFSKDLG